MTGERVDPRNPPKEPLQGGKMSAGAAAAAAASRRAQNKPTPAPQSTFQRGPLIRPAPQRKASVVSTDSNTSGSSQKTVTEKPTAMDAAKAVGWRSSSNPPKDDSRVENTTGHQVRQQQQRLVPNKGAAAAAAAMPSRRVAEPPAKKPVVAAAAARSSSLNPVKIEPRAGLQEKLLNALGQARSTPQTAASAETQGYSSDKPPPSSSSSSSGEPVKSQSSMAARLSTQLVPKSMIAPPPQRSALAAAALARPQAESKFAEIDLNVQQRQDRRKRKHKYQPAASWSTAPVAIPAQVVHAPLRASSSARQSFNTDRSVEMLGTTPEKQRPLSQFMHKLGFKKNLPVHTSQPPVATAVPEPSTMRKDKKSKFNEHKPWKHHHDAKVMTEKERRRYERLWAANKGSHVPFIIHEPVHDFYGSHSGSTPSLPNSNTSTLPVVPRITLNDDHLDHQSSDYPSEIPDSASMRSFRSSLTTDSEHYDPQTDDVCGYAVANIWHRSQLPEDTLAKVWNLVDHNHDGTLDRESFIVGTWLVDQCLYGRKLPPRVSDQIWTSAGRLNVKIRVKQKNHKFKRPHNHKHKKYSPASAAAIMAARDRSATPQSAS